MACSLGDPRFQVVDLRTKRRILQLIGKPGSFGTQTFDAVMTPEPVPQITLENVDVHFPTLRLVEMKTTRKKVRNERLEGFFFGATEREYEMARTLGDRYLFAFIVLNDANDYGRPFAVLLTLDEVQRRTGVQRFSTRSTSTPTWTRSEASARAGSSSSATRATSSEAEGAARARARCLPRPSDRARGPRDRESSLRPVSAPRARPSIAPVGRRGCRRADGRGVPDRAGG